MKSASEPLEMTKAALGRLIACQLPLGAVIYEVNAETGQESNRSYNMVRMAGVAYSLAWAARRFAATPNLGVALALASEQANRFLLRSCELQHTGFYVGEYSFEAGLTETGKLGASALFTLALLLSPRVQAYSQPIERLVETMLRCQNPNGGFWGFVGERRMAGQRYASGEALLALVRFYQQTGDRTALAAVEKAFPYYCEYQALDPHQGMILWHADTWARMAHLPEIDNTARERYRAFADHLVADLPRRQIMPGEGREPLHVGGIPFESRPGVSTSLYIEALGRVAAVHRLNGNHGVAGAYAAAIARALQFLPRLQVRTASTNASRVIGGFRGNLPSTTLRMDNDQHVITCCLALEEEGFLALEEAPDAQNNPLPDSPPIAGSILHPSPAQGHVAPQLPS